MNFVAGCLLLFMDEEDAFWSLAVIVEDLLPGYFSLQMLAPQVALCASAWMPVCGRLCLAPLASHAEWRVGAQVDQLVFRHLVEASFPRLAAHLDELGAHVAGVSTQWFLCLFVNSLPLETCLRVWDLFFLEQCASSLFRVALALVDIYAQARAPGTLPNAASCGRMHTAATGVQGTAPRRHCLQPWTVWMPFRCCRTWRPCPLTARA